MSPSSIPTRRPLLPVFAACAAAGLLAGTSRPLVPLALERQGVDKALIGVIAAGWGIGMLLTAPRISQLAARFGTVPLMVVAVVIGAAVSVGYTFVSNPYAWFALNLTHGAVDGVPWVLSEIWINMVARANTVFSMLYIAGGLVGQPLTGAAMDHLGDAGFGWTLAFFYVVAGLGALAALRGGVKDRRHVVE